MVKIELRKSHLKALLQIAAKQDIRYYLCGICLEVVPGDGARLIATDGHVMAVIKVGQDRIDGSDITERTQWIIPRSVIELVKLDRELNGGLVIFEQDGLDLSLHDPAGQFYVGFNAIEGKYPDYRKAVPKHVDGSAGCYNPKYLARFQAVAEIIFGRSSFASFRQGGKSGAALVQIDSDPDGIFLGIVMPMHGHEIGPFKAPAWVHKEAA